MATNAVYAGPLLRCRLPGTITTLRTVCSNGKCTESTVTTRKVTKYCPECGSPTISREFHKNPGDDLMQQFQKDTRDALLGYNTALHDLYVVRRARGRSGTRGTRDYWLPSGEILEVASLNMDAEIRQFREQHVVVVQRAVTIYGDDRVTVTWAVLDWSE